MNKFEWKKLLETGIIALNKDATENGQAEMIKSFNDEEADRIDLFDINQNVGSKEEMIQLFNSYQGSYMYENNSNFSKMSLFENDID